MRPMPTSSHAIEKQRSQLLAWYRASSRDLPWRRTKEPYAIWISEVMLQQTTVAAVIPYYEKFMARFNTVNDLADATENDVLSYWSGLGYYSRARNLHKAAKAIQNLGYFPKGHKELLELPGFGPYTARAVASFAFSEATGVLDGNVIRFLSRFENLKVEWWTTKGRKILQDLADQWAATPENGQVNQALMELGATICIPKNPKCFVCPLQKNCLGLKEDTLDRLPLKKNRKKAEVWIWRPQVAKKNNKWGLVQNKSGPVLKDQWIWPGAFLKSKSIPKKFHFKHSITHHNIYVQVQTAVSKPPKEGAAIQWVSSQDLKSISPFSLVQKVFSHL